jgi:hypothetical protein
MRRSPLEQKHESGRRLVTEENRQQKERNDDELAARCGGYQLQAISIGSAVPGAGLEDFNLPTRSRIWTFGSPKYQGEREREAVIAQGKKAIDADIERKRDTPIISYVPK